MKKIIDLKKKGKIVRDRNGDPIRIKKTGSMELYEFQERILGDTEVGSKFQYKLPNILSHIANKARSDGINKMAFTHPYESNISLVKNLKSILETDPLAKELDIVI